MFEEIKGKLDSLDAVLNQALLERATRLDASAGFDPSANYDETELIRFVSPDAIKKGKDNACYLLIEVKLKKGDEEFRKTYIRDLRSTILLT